MFSSFINILNKPTKAEKNSKQEANTRKFFKRKRMKYFDQDQQNSTQKLDSPSLKMHRTLCHEKMLNENNKIDRISDKNEKKDEEKRKKECFKHQIDKLTNKSKEKSNNNGLKKLSKWLYNKFENSKDIELSDLNSVPESLDEQQSNKEKLNDGINNVENVNSGSDISLIDKNFEELHFNFESKNNKSFDADEEEVDDQNLIEDRLAQQFYTNSFLNLKKKNSRNINDIKDENDKKKNESQSDDTSEDECNYCKNKIKKLKSERMKLKNQLRRRSKWKKCFVVLNPIFLLAVFFYLLYSELSAVRAETVINSTVSIHLNFLNRTEENLDNKFNLSKLEQLINLTEQNTDGKNGDNSKNLSNLNKLTKKLDNDKNLNEFDNQKSSDDDKNNSNGSENLDFYSSSSAFNQPLLIPISKRNFLSNFNNANNRQQNQQFDDASLLNNLPPFKLLAVLPTKLSPQLSRHLHRSMELYYAYSEGLVSNLELAQYFEHLRHPNGAQTDLSSSLHHLQINTTITDRHHNDKFKFLLHSNHSELNFEDHLYVHLIQRIHHRNQSQHHSELNSLSMYSDINKTPIYSNDPHFKNPYFNEKQFTENFIQGNRKRLGSANHQQSTLYSSKSTQFVQYTQPEVQLSLLPLGNSSQKLINSLCDAVEIQRPVMILSLVEPTRNYYLEMLARISDIPMLTLTGEYRETASLQKLLTEGKISESSMQLSLDAPITALADATFSLLKMQHWFDAVLLIDDTSGSDLFSYRLSQLCRQNSRRYRVRQNKHSMKDQQTKYSTFASTNGRTSMDGIKNYNRKEWAVNSYQYLDSIWSRLKVIQVSKNLLQKELYLELSEIQTNHRRVVLVHCDKITTKRVIETSKTLGLLDGSKIWILLDGVIGSQITSAQFLYDVNLPVGILALHQRAPSLQDSQTLFNIVRLIGETAANTLLNAKTWMHEGNFANGTQPEVSCWQKSTSARIKYSQVVYRISTVKEKIRKIEAGQHVKVLKRKRSKGSYKYSPDQLKKLNRLANKENPPSSRQLENLTGIKRSSARYHLKNTFNLKLVKKPKVHFLTPAQIETRKVRSLKLYKFLKRNWSRVLCTDEKLFCLESSLGQREYQYLKKFQKRKHAKLFYKKNAHPKSVMVWAGICVSGRTKLYFVKPGVKVNAKYYQENVLKPLFENDFKILFPLNDGILQQDSAPGHRAKSTLKFISDSKIEFISPDLWTPNSPDNSPLDYCLWSVLKRRVNMRRPTTLGGLAKVLKEEWEKIPQSTIVNAIKSWPTRCLMIHKANGHQIEQFLR